MGAENSNKFLKIVIILLIIINAMVLVMHFKSTGRPPRPHGAQLKYRLIEELRMDEKQETQYSEMVERHRAAMNEIRKKEEETRIKIYSDLSNAHTDRDTLYDQMAQYRKEREIITFDHFMELRMILNPEQTEQFDKIIGEAVNGMEGPPGKHPPR